MNDNRDKDLLGRMLKESASERAPERFSRAVMDRIQAEGAARISTAPLIPRWGWGLIALAVAGLTLWGWFSGQEGGEDLLPAGFKEIRLPKAELPAWELPSFPPALVYGAAALGLFAVLHVWWLRRRLDRQWAF